MFRLDDLLGPSRLRSRVDEMAATLVAAGATPGAAVGILATNDVTAVVGAWATLVAGCHYVPLDPTGPVGRLATIVSRSQLAVVLTAEGGEHLATRISARSVGIVQDGPGGPSVIRRGSVTPWTANQDLAYVLFTSGSTGEPSGVAHTHASARAFVDWAVAATGLDGDDVVAGVAPLSFDLSVFDLFASVAASARLVTVPRRIAMFPRRLGDLLVEERVTVLYAVPTLMRTLLDVGASLTRLRTIVLAGEPLPVELVEQIRSQAPQARLWNWFGPTETNVCAAYELPQEPLRGAFVPIGGGAAGNRLEVVDADEAGAGELWVSGPTVMDGYLGDPSRTAARLVDRPDGRWYRTGDIVGPDRDGTWRFLHRVDDQVKRRGYRIELGDIEAALRRLHEVADAAAVVIEGDRIVAFVTGETEPKAVAARLHDLLPGWMHPDAIESVEALPATVSGKVDRQLLAERLTSPIGGGHS